MRLEGKVAIISGGARGMGAAEARIFAREGAKVLIGDLLEAEGTQVEAEINETGGEALFVRLDVTDEQSWQDAVATAVQRFGKVDILVNNAAILRVQGLEDHHRTDLGRGYGCERQGHIPWHKERHSGDARCGRRLHHQHIVGAGITGSKRNTAYHASKGVVRIFTKAAAIQYAGENIRVNSVHPGPVQTDMLASSMSVEGGRRPDEIPLGRYGRPEEVANGVLYLASDESSFVTGSELVIDGGRTAE